ncbi:hypothetical protein FVEN_g3082 [Fusarium venenatum]|uniref:Uncharacterized protein n=1 Tax=Fusarium venenatum TaxID=56646 RepID=A0A2L2SYU3_9HYPO|nr:uncharacterized protein FVRRES_06485 [Fusarium venenatum]KAG8359415.1 hypothetical protein FVEN_g3082 [Fusarium venenatum]KAH6993475.1 hypothetical protein EDB82DRAFT_555710 [Fusarium venenatum]CEI62049.1 unnamed protein product [Fusarium venenatum]
MEPTVKKTSTSRIQLGDDMDEFVLVLDPARPVKPLGGAGGHEQKKETAALQEDVVPGKAYKPQVDNTQNSAKPPTAAEKKALDDYHDDMRKLAEDSMPERDGLRVAYEDWFYTDRGSHHFDLGDEH